MKARILVLVAVCLFVGTTPAAAEMSNGRWSIGVAAGAGHYEIDTDPLADFIDDPEPTSAESQSDTYSLRAAFLVNRYFAIQAGYTDFGTVGYAKKSQCTTPGTVCPTVVLPPLEGRLGARALALTAVGVLPLTERFELFGGAGLTSIVYRNTSPDTPVYVEIDTGSREWRPTLQLGANWRFSNHWATQLEIGGIWDAADAPRTGNADLYSLTLGIAYHFGSGR